MVVALVIVVVGPYSFASPIDSDFNMFLSYPITKKWFIEF